MCSANSLDQFAFLHTFTDLIQLKATDREKKYKNRCVEYLGYKYVEVGE